MNNARITLTKLMINNVNDVNINNIRSNNHIKLELIVNVSIRAQMITDATVSEVLQSSLVAG